MDSGYIYCIVKKVCVCSEWFILQANGKPLCKLGKSVFPPQRLAEAKETASTWEPARFHVLFCKYVPSMKGAEDTVHEFFKNAHIAQGYPNEGSGTEWFLVDICRVRHVFEALDGDPVLETMEGLTRPPPVSREEPVTVAKVSISYADWKREIMNARLPTAEDYIEWQRGHPDFPSLNDLLTGCFEGITNYNTLVEGLFGRGGRQR